MAPPNIQILTPETMNESKKMRYIQQRDFVDVIKLKILREGDYPDYLDGS